MMSAHLREFLDEYEPLRKKLVVFFRYNGVADPEDLADETIARAVLRLSGEIKITTTVRGYLFGIAYNVLREERKKPADLPIDEIISSHLGVTEEPAPRKTDIDEILRVLRRKDRQLLLDYSDEEDRAALAARLGIEMKVLRVRYHRALEKVRDSIKLRAKKGNSG